MALMPAFLPKESSSLLTRDFVMHAAGLFQRPQQAGNDEVSLQNIYRLLEMYRFDAFVGYMPKGVLQVRVEDDADQGDANIAAGSALKHALDEAKARVFPQVEKEAVVELLEGLIRTLAGRTVPNQAELRQATKFFEELATELAG